jgi:hypothetical protein
MSIYHRTDHWIDDFQMKLSMPVAMKIAEFCRDPEMKGDAIPLLDLRQYMKMNPEKRAGDNVLSVVLGPFGVVRDNNYTWWQGIKVIVGNATVVAVLCRLTNQGNGGFYNIKVWDIQNQTYFYHGDPAGERQIHPNGVIRIVNDYLAATFHVGHVEQDELAAHNDQIIEANKSLIAGDEEAMRRDSFEKAARQVFEEPK